MQNYLKCETKLMCFWMLGLMLLAIVVSLLSCGKHTLRQHPPDDAAGKTQGKTHEKVHEAQEGPLFDPAAGVRIGYDLLPVYFDFDRYNIRNDQVARLVTNMEALQEIAGSVSIEGHCDERGTIEYNLTLGQRRADVVRKHLITLGVPEEILRTVSYGEDRPVDKGHDEAAWQKNRRAEFMEGGK